MADNHKFGTSQVDKIMYGNQLVWPTGHPFEFRMWSSSEPAFDDVFGTAAVEDNGDGTWKVYGDATHLKFNSDTANNTTKIEVITSRSFTDASELFNNFTNMTEFIASPDDFGNVTNFMLCWGTCRSLTSFPVIDTSKGISFDNTWSGSGIVNFPELDFSSGNDFTEMFSNCSDLLSVGPLLSASSGDTYANMFHSCRKLVCLTSLDTRSHSDAENIFFGTGDLVSPNSTEQTALESSAGALWTNANPCP